ncbi:MAG: hypothetical protein DRR08_00290 [Candidatus Parabeggiatoa sp. nov. 2]|nr:MAG: hypothetical protein B6247_00510 [Beggiatoa sp. 4572_84]RKZ64624.1 MAG: hypothetical protein DRR08_00290 [Gammaproteobacteria bacterium]
MKLRVAPCLRRIFNARGGACQGRGLPGAMPLALLMSPRWGLSGRCPGLFWFLKKVILSNARNLAFNDFNNFSTINDLAKFDY